MPELYQSLSHSRWHGKYHVVFVPKKRRSVLYGRIRQALGPIFHALARQKECRIIEGHICKDHVHIVYRNTAKIRCGISHRVYQGQECYCDCSSVQWKGSQLYRREFLDSRLCGINRWI